jgi:MFS family permease
LEEAVSASSASELPSRRYAWLVFALSFLLLLSDYMSRQVLNAVFPLIKAEWSVTDTQLGSLSGIVALTVGILTFPLSLVADRFGRVKGLTIMAMVWSLATLGCGLAQNYPQMLLARLLVGVGEAGYGSVGVAVVLGVFPASMRATLTAAFMAGGLLGSLFGMAIGGAVAVHLGWRWSFATMALFGLVLALIYPLVVRDRTRLHQDNRAPLQWRRLFNTHSVIAVYAGSGLQLFIAGALMAWIPTYLNRYYGLAADKAGAGAAGLVLSGSLGMVICGMASDRLSKGSRPRKLMLAIGYCLIASVALLAAFRMPPGAAQLAMVGLGMFFAAGTTGPAGAAVANLTPLAIHGTAFATLTLANNLLGLAPGPVAAGMLADRFGLQTAMQFIPLVGLAAAFAFWIGLRNYDSDLRCAEAASSVVN